MTVLHDTNDGDVDARINYKISIGHQNKSLNSINILIEEIDRRMRKKIKVKSLEGTPFMISEEEEIGRGNFGIVVRAYKKD